MNKLGYIVSISFLTLGIAGCSAASEDTQADQSTNSDNITITDFSDRTVSFDQTPEKIVSLGNGELDIIYALGEEVIGRPTGEAVVEAADDALEVGSIHSADLEKITSLDADVVLGNHPMNTDDVQSIESIGSEMILTSADSVDDIKKQIELFGEMLDKEDAADKLIHTIEKEIEQLQSMQSDDKTRALLIYGAPGTNMAALPNSLSGDLLTLAGGENIAEDYPSLDMYPQYAQLNTERIMEANPEIILLMSHGNPEEVKESFMKEMSDTAGWDELDAVKNDQFYILPSELFGTNPGTKMVEALEHMQNLLKEAKE